MPAYEKRPDPTEQLKEALKGPSVGGGAWLLCGPESYLRNYYLSLMRSRVIPDPDMGYFDHVRLSYAQSQAASMTLGESLSASLEGLPVMNEGKLIEISEPCFSDMRPTELQAFCEVISTVSQYPYATVVIGCAEEEFETRDYRAPLGPVWRALAAAGVRIVPFPLQTTAKLLTWCGRHFASEGIEAAPTVMELMIARVGNTMTALLGEIGKLCCYLKAQGRNVVTRQDVLDICSVTESEESFGIKNALLARDMHALFLQYAKLKRDKYEPVLLLGRIHSVVLEMWRVGIGLAEGYAKEDLMRMYDIKEYPMRLAVKGVSLYSPATLSEMLRLCAETDVLLKSSKVDSYVQIERLICAFGRLEK